MPQNHAYVLRLLGFVGILTTSFWISLCVKIIQFAFRNKSSLPRLGLSIYIYGILVVCVRGIYITAICIFAPENSQLTLVLPLHCVKSYTGPSRVCFCDISLNKPHLVIICGCLFCVLMCANHALELHTVNMKYIQNYSWHATITMDPHFVRWTFATNQGS